MLIGLFLLKFIVPIYSTSRIMNVPIIIVYTILGTFIYFIYMYRTGTIESIFGNKLLNKIKKALLCIIYIM